MAGAFILRASSRAKVDLPAPPNPEIAIIAGKFKDWIVLNPSSENI